MIIRIGIFYLQCATLFSTVTAQVNSLDEISKSLIKIQVNTTQGLVLDSAGLIEEDYSLGTGFYISEDGLFLTAAHVIESRNKDEQNNIICYDNITSKSFSPVIVFVDIESDIALLQNVSFTGYKKQNQFFIDLNSYKKNTDKEKTQIYSFGFPNELQGYKRITSFSFGEVLSVNQNLTGYKKIPGRKNVSLASTVVLSGCSGGLLTDLEFQPIGLILGSILENNRRTTYYKSLYQVRQLMEEYEVF